MMPILKIHYKTQSRIRTELARTLHIPEIGLKRIEPNPNDPLSGSPIGKCLLVVNTTLLSWLLTVISGQCVVQAVTESSWESLVLGSQRPVLVDFWAPWCGPCKLIAPMIEELAKEYSGKIECYKVNTDECPNIATQYNIRSIPTVLFFKNGERIESVVGAVPKTTLTSTIDKYLAS